MTRDQGAIAFLRQKVAEWRRIGDRDTWNASDEDIKCLMGRHSMWDNPPVGYSEEDLIRWSRGYLQAEETHYLNAVEAVSFALLVLDPDGSLKDSELLDLTKRRGKNILRDYGLLLQELLDDFVRGSGTRHTVAIDASTTMTRVTVQFLQDDPFATTMPQFVEEKIHDGYQALRASEGPGVVMFRVREEPIEVPPGITVLPDQPIAIAWPSTIHFWSNVQAWEDSNDIIAEVLALQKNQSESILNPRVDAVGTPESYSFEFNI